MKVHSLRLEVEEIRGKKTEDGVCVRRKSSPVIPAIVPPAFTTSLNNLKLARINRAVQGR